MNNGERCPQTWVTELADLLVEMKAVINTAWQSSLTCLTPKQLTDFDHHYDRLVEQGLLANTPGTTGRPVKKNGGGSSKAWPRTCWIVSGP